MPIDGVSRRCGEINGFCCCLSRRFFDEGLFGFIPGLKRVPRGFGGVQRLFVLALVLMGFWRFEGNWSLSGI